MPIEITMPALSPTMEEGTLAKWLVKEGDSVAPGDVIAEIETDKATMEVEAIDEGVLGKILVPAGSEGVKVNTPIAVLVQEGEDASAIAATPASAEAPKKAVAAPKPQSKPEAKPQPVAEKPAPAAAPAIPSAPEPAPAAGHARPEKRAGERVFSSPLARRIAGEAGIDIATIEGSGPKGRVVKADIERAIAEGPAVRAAASATAAAPASAPTAIDTAAADEATLKLFEEGSYELVPHDNMRKTIARRLTEAKSTIPHFYLTVDCNIDALLDLRSRLNKAAPVRDGEPAYKLSVNDLVIKALALALRDVPDANVSWTSTHMIRHRHADIGVAVAIPGGLITPVLRHAEEKSLSVISNEMKDLAGRARERKLKPHEYQGGSSAVSNLGMMGVKSFSAVINPPHATILAVGAGEQRAIVVDGKIEIATIMSVTLSTDHRCVDGALGAELIAAFKGYIENPLGMLV